MSRLSFATTCLLSTFIVTPLVTSLANIACAQGDPSDDARKEARERFDRGLRLFNQGDNVVFVDGQPRGAYSGPLQLPHGRHRIRVERAEFFPFEREVAVEKARNADVAVDLEPTPEKRANYRRRSTKPPTTSRSTIPARKARATHLRSHRRFGRGLP